MSPGAQTILDEAHERAWMDCVPRKYRRRAMLHIANSLRETNVISLSPTSALDRMHRDEARAAFVGWISSSWRDAG